MYDMYKYLEKFAYCSLKSSAEIEDLVPEPILDLLTLKVMNQTTDNFLLIEDYIDKPIYGTSIMLNVLTTHKFKAGLFFIYKLIFDMPLVKMEICELIVWSTDMIPDIVHERHQEFLNSSKKQINLSFNGN
ncbi:MAG: hypothetical protein WCI92_13800 [Bacteroidota bacterium]